MSLQCSGNWAWVRPCCSLPDIMASFPLPSNSLSLYLFIHSIIYLLFDKCVSWASILLSILCNWWESQRLMRWEPHFQKSSQSPGSKQDSCKSLQGKTDLGVSKELHWGCCECSQGTDILFSLLTDLMKEAKNSTNIHLSALLWYRFCARFWSSIDDQTLVLLNSET